MCGCRAWRYYQARFKPYKGKSKYSINKVKDKKLTVFQTL